MQTPADAIIFASALDWQERRSVLHWLLLSLLLHALLVWWLQGRFELPRYQAPAITPPIELTLRRALPQATALPAETVVTERPTPGEQPEETSVAPTPQAAESEQAQSVLPMDLSLPDLIDPEAEASTDNGATVMNAELLDRLQRAPRRSGVEARVERGASGEFQGGSWVEFVRNGDACFQVARANALLSFDYDVWYRVPCPDDPR